MMGATAWPTRDILAHRAETTPTATALIDADDGCEWTYAEFDRCVATVASDVAEIVSKPTDRLGTLLGTRVEFAAVYFAAMRLGVTVVPLNVRETASELEEKADRTELDGLVCESATEAVAREIVDCPVLSVDEPDADDVLGLRTTEGAEAETDLSAPSDALEPDRTHLLMFTSGTAGESKAVRLTVGNLLASATASAFRLGLSANDRWLCCLPTYHMGGLAPLVRSTLYGTTTVIQREFDPEETARVIAEHGITGVSLVPTMCKRLLSVGWQPPETLRFVLLGGAATPTELVERCRERNVPIHPTYGMTEAASQIATARPDEAFSNPGTVGRPLLSTDVSIVDEHDEPVPTGEPGELVVSGPTVTPGYLDDEHTASAFGPHGLRTGDLGYRDETGRLWITGRRTDRIVTGGENVDPEDVRTVLRSHPSIDEAAVVGLADEEWGERVSALVVPADGAPVDLDRLVAHCDDRLAGFKRPRTMATADALPRTPSGTVDRDAVRDRLSEGGVDLSR
ncbi:o-succinylbenzoate--CoA ligase [Natrialbaceae archaeon A-arb3/5]